MITPEHLGSERFKNDYGLRVAYGTGAMVKGIASTALVIRMARAGGLAFYGSGGMRLQEVEAAITEIQNALPGGEPYGINLLANTARSNEEMEMVDLFLSYVVRSVEASAYVQVTAPLVKFLLKGLGIDRSEVHTSDSRH